jgi:hypothetical protein
MNPFLVALDVLGNVAFLTLQQSLYVLLALQATLLAVLPLQLTMLVWLSGYNPMGVTIVSGLGEEGFFLFLKFLTYILRIMQIKTRS